MLNVSKQGRGVGVGASQDSSLLICVILMGSLALNGMRSARGPLDGPGEPRACEAEDANEGGESSSLDSSAGLPPVNSSSSASAPPSVLCAVAGLYPRGPMRIAKPGEVFPPRSSRRQSMSNRA